MNCNHCGATTDNGLALCSMCQRKAEVVLDVLPIYFRNLARWRRPNRPNGSLGTSGQWLIKRGESDVQHIAVALERASNDLTTWARALADDRGVTLPEADTEAEVVSAVCALMASHLTSVATLEWCGQFVRDLERHERVLCGLTEKFVPGWYAGSCRRRVSMDATCGAPTYVVPELTWVTCSACGTTTYARDHLDALIEEAADWMARPLQIAEALVALLDSEHSVTRLYDRIRKWDSLGWLKSYRRLDADGDPIGPKRYRMGDVLALTTRGEGECAG